MADPYDFYRMRLYFCAGQKRLRKQRASFTWTDFGVRVLGGLRVQQKPRPGLALNSPMHTCAGSVGRLLPGIDYSTT